MFLKQLSKSLLNRAFVNPVKRSIFTTIKNFNLINKNHNINNISQVLLSKKYFFTSNKEEKKEEAKTQEQQKNEKDEKGEKEDKQANTNEEEDRTINEKYKELKTLYTEQEQKLDQVKKKFHEIKDLYLKGIEEIDAIKLRNDREIKNTKDYAITKFAKDLLDVHDNFTRALGVISDKQFNSLSEEEKIETFNSFVEGSILYSKFFLRHIFFFVRTKTNIFIIYLNLKSK